VVDVEPLVSLVAPEDVTPVGRVKETVDSDSVMVPEVSDAADVDEQGAQ